MKNNLLFASSLLSVSIVFGPGASASPTGALPSNQYPAGSSIPAELEGVTIEQRLNSQMPS